MAELHDVAWAETADIRDRLRHDVPVSQIGRMRVDALAEIERGDHLRALVNGGPCSTCGGRGDVPCGRPHWHDGPCDPSPAGDHYGPCPNPDCRNGRKPGIIERLEAAMETTGTRTLHYRMLAAVIADLRHLGGGE